MQVDLASLIEVKLKDALLEALWIQWRSLGTRIEVKRTSRSLVDPEALLLMSLTLRHHEKRLWDLMDAWARNGSRLFSIQRVKNLEENFPQLTRGRLSEFALRAKLDGKDHRWRSLMGADPGPHARTQEMWEAYPKVWNPAALLLRLRLGLGVGIVSDLLAILLSQRGHWISSREVAKATGYSVYSIRRSADNMADARLIESTRKKPVQYRVEPRAWCELLGVDDALPTWRFWYQLFTFLAYLLVSLEGGDWKGLSPYLLSSKLRDSVELHHDAFALNQIEYPDPREYLGEEYLPAFRNLIEDLVVWIKDKS